MTPLKRRVRGSTERIYIQTLGGITTAKRADGWVLAECSIVDRVVNGSHDGTEKGRRHFKLLADSLLDGSMLPREIEYTNLTPNGKVTGAARLFAQLRLNAGLALTLDRR